MLHLLGGAAVHLCKDTRACTSGHLPPALPSAHRGPEPRTPAPRTARPMVKAPQLPGQAARRLPLPLPCSTLCQPRVFQSSQGHPSPDLAPQASHPPGTGVPCTLPGSGRRSLRPGPRRCRRSHRGSGSRGRGLKGRRGSLSPITVLPEASGRLGASRLPPAAWASPAWPPARCTLPISQCRPEKPGGQSHLYLPM